MKSIVFLCFTFIFSLFFSACDDTTAIPGSANSRVTVTLPAYPPGHPALRGWLMVRDGAEPVYLAPTDRDMAVTLDKNQCTPLLFYPLSGDSAGESPLRFFAPAGCVYPASTTATWPDGFGARICLDLLTQSSPGMTPEQRRAFCNRFNWQRFSSEVAALEQTASESEEPDELPSIYDPFNPWNLDRQKIITAICAGKFTKTTLKVRAIKVTVSIDSPESTPSRVFYQPYVLAPPVLSVTTEDTEPRIATVTVPYRAGDSGNVLFDPNAEAVLLVCPQASSNKNYRLAALPLGHYTWGDGR